MTAQEPEEADRTEVPPTLDPCTRGHIFIRQIRTKPMARDREVYRTEVCPDRTEKTA